MNLLFPLHVKKERGINAGQIAKRLLDFGVHAPTVYFPLLVREAMMIEPTETESKETLDNFAAIMTAIDEETKSDPDSVRNAPLTLGVSKLDDALAANNKKHKKQKKQLRFVYKV